MDKQKIVDFISISDTITITKLNDGRIFIGDSSFITLVSPESLIDFGVRDVPKQGEAWKIVKKASVFYLDYNALESVIKSSFVISDENRLKLIGFSHGSTCYRFRSADGRYTDLLCDCMHLFSGNCYEYYQSGHGCPVALCNADDKFIALIAPVRDTGN